MSPRGGLLLLILALLALPTASAVTISTTGAFATTHSGAVSWKASNGLTVQLWGVNSTALQLDGFGLDWTSTTGNLTVDVTHWATDNRTFSVTADATTGMNFTFYSPGFTFNVTRNGLAWGTCLPPSCVISINPATSATVSIVDAPLTSLNAGHTDTPQAPAAAGGPSGGNNPILNAGAIIANLPSPAKLFPHFSPFQWLGTGSGILLLMAGSTKTAVLIPSVLRRLLSLVPDRRLKLALGVAVLLVVYATAAQTIQT